MSRPKSIQGDLEQGHARTEQHKIVFAALQWIIADFPPFSTFDSPAVSTVHEYLMAVDYMYAPRSAKTTTSRLRWTRSIQRTKLLTLLTHQSE